MKREKRIHWGGGIITNNVSRYVAGWPVCCSGYRAEFIRARNLITKSLPEVTCQNCLRLIAAYNANKNNEELNMFKNQTGDANPASKLTWRIVENIRKDYSKGNMTQKYLAQKYNVSPSTIGKILRRESWVRY